MRRSAWFSMAFALFLLVIPPPSLSQENFWQATGGPLGADITCMLTAGDTIAVGDRNSGTYISSDQGASWVHSGPDSIPILAIARHNNGTLFLGTLQHGIWRSTDGGLNWSQSDLLPLDVSAIAFDCNGFVLAATTTNGMHRSTDNGVTWSQFWATSNICEALVVLPDSAILAATNWGIWRSTNDGSTWAHVFPGNFYIHGPYAVATDFLGAVYTGCALQGGYYGCSIGVAQSVTGGDDWTTTWIPFLWNDTCTYLRSMVVNQIGTRFAASTRGVARSTDAGQSWYPVNSGLADTNVTSLALNSQGYIFAGTTTGGVCRSVESTTSIPQMGDLPPLDFTLAQNYPNPFNPKTTIAFSVPYRCHLTLRLFDPLGREVTTLFDGDAMAGPHTVEWNAAQNPSGVYFCKMQTGASTESIKLLLIK